MDRIRADDQMEDHEKNQMIRSKRMKSIAEVLEVFKVLVDTHFFNEFSETKSSAFLKRVLANQAAIDMRLFKKTRRTLNCSPKTMKVIREIQENLLCVGKRKESIIYTGILDPGMRKNKRNQMEIILKLLFLAFSRFPHSWDVIGKM